MATGVRVAITLACTECKRRNYQSQKSKRNTPDRVELRKTRIAGKDGQLHVIPNSLIDKNEWVVLKRVSRRSTRRKR